MEDTILGRLDVNPEPLANAGAEPPTLTDRVHPQLPAQPRRSRLLLIDRDAIRAWPVVRAIGDLADVRVATDVSQGQRMAASRPFDLVLISDDLPDAGLAEVVAQWRDGAAQAEAPLVALCAQANDQAELQAMSAGTVGVLPRAAAAELLKARLRGLLSLVRDAMSWRQRAQQDALTGLASRSQIDAMLLREWSRCQRGTAPMSLLMVDVDHFKAYNDTHGHPAGDACLRAVAGALARHGRRAADLVGRFGGEEFLLLLPGTDALGAAELGASVVQSVAALRLPHGGLGPGAVVTVSVGGASTLPHERGPRGWQELLAAADAALYRAKRLGRNRSDHRVLQSDRLPRAALGGGRVPSAQLAVGLPSMAH